MRLTPTALFSWFRTPTELRLPWTISFVLTILVTFFVAILYRTLPPVIPLFYSLPQLSQHLVDKNWIALFPVLLITISWVHLNIVHISKDYQVLLLQLFSWTTVAIQVLLSLTIIRSMLLVI